MLLAFNRVPTCRRSSILWWQRCCRSYGRTRTLYCISAFLVEGGPVVVLLINYSPGNFKAPKCRSPRNLHGYRPFEQRTRGGVLWLTGCLITHERIIVWSLFHQNLGFRSSSLKVDWNITSNEILIWLSGRGRAMERCDKCISATNSD